MRNIPLLLILCIAVTAAPALAGRLTSTMLLHNATVYQAYPGNSDPRTDGELNNCWLGYLGNSSGSDTITAVPGILAICPGCEEWCNFIFAAQQIPPVEYTIKNTTFVKVTPEFIQCGEDILGNPIFPAHTVTQQGTPNIRRWWPLMYELPGTTFTLTILYGTSVLFDDDGPGPNPPAWAHVEQWEWLVSADFLSLSNLLDLFHEVPFGKDEVPLISDEDLYTALKQKVASAEAFYLAGNLAMASLILADFELEAMDGCIDESPAFPLPGGPGTGIANTAENPACCKLLVDIEYILQTLSIGQPKKGR